MLTCEGYKMFRGTMTITPLNGREPFDKHGTWLYKPQYDCWYCDGTNSYGALICKVKEDETE